MQSNIPLEVNDRLSFQLPAELGAPVNSAELDC